MEIKNKLNEYYKTDLASQHQQSLDPEAVELFKPITLDSPKTVKYIQSFCQKYGLSEVAGRNGVNQPIQGSYQNQGAQNGYGNNSQGSQQGGYGWYGGYGG